LRFGHRLYRWYRKGRIFCHRLHQLHRKIQDVLLRKATDYTPARPFRRDFYGKDKIMCNGDIFTIAFDTNCFFKKRKKFVQ
jgi:hypothetical protein